MWMRILEVYNLIMILPNSVSTDFSQDTSQHYIKKSIEFLFYVLENWDAEKNNWIFLVPCQAHSIVEIEPASPESSLLKGNSSHPTI